MPNFVNSIPFSQIDWQMDEYMGVPLNEDLFNDLINNPDNRALRLAARGNPSNWTVPMREQVGPGRQSKRHCTPSGPPFDE